MSKNKFLQNHHYSVKITVRPL